MVRALPARPYTPDRYWPGIIPCVRRYSGSGGVGARPSLDGARREPANDDAAEHGVQFRLVLRW